ncbi:MAG: hypothetical protein Q8880_06260 [Bacteroidota bacterium]|nr:hypothetical protein [Bacteroidota bacterium]
MSFYSKTFAQFEMKNSDDYPRIKNGTTYVIMKDPEDANSAEYIDAIKKNWTISKKVEFIKSGDFEKYLKPENSFLSFFALETITTSTNNTGFSKSSMTGCQISLCLWTSDLSYFKKKRNVFDGDRFRNILVKVKLQTDMETYRICDKIFSYQFNGEGHIYNWSPGIAQNYIKEFKILLDKGEKVNPLKDYFDEVQLKNLKSGILYVPNYVLISRSIFNGKETKQHEEKEIFEDYKYKYKILTANDLNEKILSDDNKFYYMFMNFDNTGKFIYITNAKTGEVIYSVQINNSINIKSNDLKQLYKIINHKS